MIPPEQLEALFEALTSAFGDKPRRNEPLSGHTTSRLGGPADIWFPVDNLAELVEVVKLARYHQVRIFMLGGGANLLITDAGVRGLVIENRANQVHFPPPGRQGETTKIIAESGTALPSLARRCAKRGLSGFEWAVGVPGTVGGAVVNNAGAYNSDIAATLIRAELLSVTGERIWQPVSWFEYDYRTSRLKREESGAIVLQAELQMIYASRTQVETQMNAFNQRRKNSQPPGATMGSMFKNPPGDYAGRLIEAAGLKGHRIGRAQISLVHANFFQNLGNATSTEMLQLIDTARDTVETKFGVKLKLEIEVVGDIS